MLRHEATHVEATRRPTTSPPTRNRDLVTLAPEKQPVVKNSFFDVQNPLLPQILDDAPKRAAHENSAGVVDTTSPELAISGKSVEKSQVAKIPKLDNHKKLLLPPGPPQKGPTNKKAAKKQTDSKNSPRKLESEEKQTAGHLVTNSERGNLPKSIMLPAQLKVTSNKSNMTKTDFKAGEEERRRALIFRQAVEYDEGKKRCDELEEEIARLELQFGCNSEFVKSEIKLEPIDVNQDMECSGEEEVGLGKEERGENERKMEVVEEEEEDWEVGGVGPEMVPPGWKVFKGPARKFKSPEGFVFETRFSVIFIIIIHCRFSTFVVLSFEIFCFKRECNPVHDEQQLRGGFDQDDGQPLGEGGLEEGGKLPSRLEGQTLLQGHHRGRDGVPLPLHGVLSRHLGDAHLLQAGCQRLRGRGQPCRCLQHDRYHS